ncbi:MAG: hypothetical protein HOP31_08765 [Ignavibacteria bacterium]|nr:hypothetical protein [Ignavibacteria bacterium]
MSETKTNTTKTAFTTKEAWFNSFIAETVHGIRVDELALKTNTADPDKISYYDSLMAGDAAKLINYNREFIFKYYISEITKAYIVEVLNLILTNSALKLAFRLSNSKILVWAEIKDDDEISENALLLAEAKVNAKFCSKGFHISSTIVEQSDELSLPPHYSDILPVINS